MQDKEEEQRTNKDETQGKEPKKRGFAAMSPERQREIAGRGGKAAHSKGTAHRFTRDEAKAAGRKGGESVSKNREHMAEIGRRGGQKGSSKKNNDNSQPPENIPAPPEE